MPKTLVGQSVLFASEFGVSCPGGLYCPQRQTVCDRQTQVHIQISCHRQTDSQGGVRQNKHNIKTDVKIQKKLDRHRNQKDKMR